MAETTQRRSTRPSNARIRSRAIDVVPPASAYGYSTAPNQSLLLALLRVWAPLPVIGTAPRNGPINFQPLRKRPATCAGQRRRVAFAPLKSASSERSSDVAHKRAGHADVRAPDDMPAPQVGVDPAARLRSTTTAAHPL